jgi:hypothetical protein
LISSIVLGEIPSVPQRVKKRAEIATSRGYADLGPIVFRKYSNPALMSVKKTRNGASPFSSLGVRKAIDIPPIN